MFFACKKHLATRNFLFFSIEELITFPELDQTFRSNKPFARKTQLKKRKNAIFNFVFSCFGFSFQRFFVWGSSGIIYWDCNKLFAGKRSCKIATPSFSENRKRK